MNEPWQWTEQDLLALITNQVKESIRLDYKDCEALENNDRKKDGVSKDVSAFANSDGGIIVYGMHEENRLPVRIELGYDPSIITREWLEQIINSRIQRRIDGVRINQVELSATSPGNVVYVVVIPQSPQAPHMASDYRYYKRFNFISVPMEDYEVRDVSRRFLSPRLELTFEVLRQNVATAQRSAYDASLKLTVYITNRSQAPAEYARVRIGVPRLLPVEGVGPEFSTGQVQMRVGSEVLAARLYTDQYGIPSKMPIWEGVRWPVGSFTVLVPAGDREVPILWDISAPGMRSQKGVIAVVNSLLNDYTGITPRPDLAELAEFVESG